MSPPSFQSYPRSGPPRPVADGVKIRSRQGAIGSTWWSKRFLDVLESLALGTRLSRGKSYARRGQVMSVEVTAGVVTAKVQGSRTAPYRVAIGLAPFAAAQWAAVESALAGDAFLAAQLLAGEVPAELEELCAGAGAPLFPQAVRDLRMSCSCPDGAVPCKHLAAVFYVLAERFDDDPFEILRWRGRGRGQLLAGLRDTVRPSGASSRPTAQPVSAVSTLSGLTVLTAAPERFWSSPVPLPARPAGAVDDPRLMPRLLGTPPAELGGEDMRAELAQWYATLTGGRS